MGGYNSLPELKMPDVGEGIQRMMALRGMMQQQQAQGIAIEQKKLELKDQQALRGLYVKHNGDLDKVIAEAPQAGVSPQTIQALQLHNIDAKTKTADLVSKQGANALQQADLMNGAHDAVDKAPAEQKPAVYQQQLQSLDKMGIDVSQLPQQYPGDDQFKMIGAMVKGHKQQVEDAFKQAEGEKNKAQAGEATARTEEVKVNTARLRAEMNFYQQRGLAPGVPLDAQEAADWLQKNPGKGAADFMKYKAGLAPAMRLAIETGAGGGANATPEEVAKKFGISRATLDQTAEKYFQTGQLPPVGRGISGPAFTRAIMNRASELHPGESLAGNAAAFKANSDSLKSIQKTFDNVTAFENTAGKNLDTFLGLANKVVDSGSPWINRPLRSLSASMLGSDDQAAFNAARTTALAEIAKVLSSANASSGVLSDSARHEVEGLIGPNATLKQIVSAANVLKKDMANRHESYAQQIKDIQDRLNGPSGSPQGGSTPPGGKEIHYKIVKGQLVAQ